MHTSGIWTRATVAGAVVILGTGAALPPAGAEPLSTRSSGVAEEIPGTEGGEWSVTSTEGVEVPVYGRVWVEPVVRGKSPVMVFAVHGVRRVRGGTVVYYSAGSSGEPVPSVVSDSQKSVEAVNPGTGLGTVRLIDPVGVSVYATVADPRPDYVRPFATSNQELPRESGVMVTAFAVVPELPVGVDRVDVDLVYGVTIPGVPVQDGFMEPVVEGKDSTLLGSGWPDVDEGVIAQVESPESFVYPLTAVTAAVDGSSATRETEDEVTVDLAADVLFEFDKADLTSAASARLADVAGRVKAEAAPGALSIIGHTDSEGSDAYNVDLSKRRAAAVEAALVPLIGRDDLEVRVEGRGEAEPVADNGTESGRAANRRVAVSFTKDDQ